jgi:AcrR family transcriptional regulator
MVAEKLHPGRPRDPEVEQRILDAVLSQLAEEGFTRMSVDAVALAAGVSKPTIYRRWPTKADLTMAALRRLQIAEPSVATGSPEGDLAGILENFTRSLLRPNGMPLVGTVLAEERHNPDLLRLFRERLVVPRRRLLREVLEAARVKGLVSPKADLDAAVSMMAGAIYAKYLASSRIPAGFPAEVAAIAWRGIAKRR